MACEYKYKEEKGFAVQPINTCNHYSMDNLYQISQQFESKHEAVFKEKCTECNNYEENWICLQCAGIFCSRYVQGHMQAHSEQTDHHVCLSMADFSFWCFKCEAYITSRNVTAFQQFLSFIRFGHECHHDEEIGQILPIISNLKIKSDELNEQIILKKIREKAFKKIVVITGAGLSMAAGVPDFRDPSLPIYQILKDKGLPYNEAVLELAYYKENPSMFYEFLNLYMGRHPKPTLSHKLVTKIADHKQLLFNLTQNIDGLQLAAKIPSQLYVECQGNLRGAKCVECSAETDIKKFTESVKNQVILKCEKCQNGLIKPNIIMFGEQMPAEFFQNWKRLPEADLLIVIGSSLNVMPFTMLDKILLTEIPSLVINYHNVLSHRKNNVFIQGDIEESAKRLLRELKWD